MSVDELKQSIDKVTCENDDYDLTCSYQKRELEIVHFYFEEKKLVGVSTYMPVFKTEHRSTLDSELSEMQRVTGVTPLTVKGETNRTYFFQMEFSNCKSVVKGVTSSTDSLFTFCQPNLYISTYIKNPAKKEFKLLDLTLGKSTYSDVLKIIKDNEWKHFTFPWKKSTTVTVYSIKMDGISYVKMTLYDNILQSIEYIIKTDYKDKKSFLRLLTEKYGNKMDKEKGYYKWDINKDTRDYTILIMSYENNPSKVKSISYTLSWLSQKENETDFFNYKIKKEKEEALKSKAF